MKPLDWLRRWFRRAPVARTDSPHPKVLITSECVEALIRALRPSFERRHEGVAYLLGRTDGIVTLCITAFVPVARTTSGSFHVDARAMAAWMQTAGMYELQIVAQVHTHPGQAWHTDGDVEGARIRYPGFASIVIPDYGARLPMLDGAAVYLWSVAEGWRTLDLSDLIIIPGAGSWTKQNG